MYLLNNEDSMHELNLKNRLEINIYNIPREASKRKGILRIKEDNKFKIGNDFDKYTIKVILDLTIIL